MIPRLTKFLHTMGPIGFMGALACLLVLLAYAPPPAALPEYALVRGAMGGIATWVFLPSLAMTLIAGLLALALNHVYQNAGWALAKLATGILVFEWGFVAVLRGAAEREVRERRAWVPFLPLRGKGLPRT